MNVPKLHISFDISIVLGVPAMNKPTINSFKKSSILSLLLVLSLSASASASASASEHIAHSYNDHGITTNSVNLSAQGFFNSYISKSPKDRERAELYLLGVMDSAEGESWCDYKTFKTTTLRERIFEGFKNIKKNKLGNRASTVIKEILNQRYPCRRKK